jgi:Type III restriction enzyme, res subunit
MFRSRITKTKTPKKLTSLPDLGAAAETSLTSRGYGILKASVDAGVIAALKEYTTVSPVSNQLRVANAPAPRFPVYLESSSKLYIPKHLGCSTYGPPLVDKTDDGEPMACAFVGQLRESQHAPVAAYLEAARDPTRRGGIINMACAAGKTVMALYIAGVLGRRTIIIVHKEFLLNQWLERIEQFVPAARVGASPRQHV